MIQYRWFHSKASYVLLLVTLVIVLNSFLFLRILTIVIVLCPRPGWNNPSKSSKENSHAAGVTVNRRTVAFDTVISFLARRCQVDYLHFPLVFAAYVVL